MCEGNRIVLCDGIRAVEIHMHIFIYIFDLLSFVDYACVISRVRFGRHLMIT